MRFARAAALSFTLSFSFACGEGSPLSLGSSSESGKSGFDAARFEKAAETKMAEVLKRPSVDKAMTDAWDTIGKDPQVSGAGEALMAAISSSPAFMPAAAEFLAKLQTSPSFVALVTNFMAANPGIDMSGFEAAFGQHVQTQIDRPAVQEALNASIGRLVERPEVQGALNQLVHAITVDSGISQEIGRNIGNKLNDPAVISKLEAKAGVKPGDSDYDDKLFAYLTDDARLESFMVGFAALFAEHQAPRTAVVTLLQNPAVINATAEQVANMLRGPEFYTLAEAALVAVLDGSDRTVVEAKLDALVNQPAVIAAFAAWVNAIASVPEVKQGFADAFRQLFADERFAKLLLTTFVE